MELFLPQVSRWDETSPLPKHADLKFCNIPLEIEYVSQWLEHAVRDRRFPTVLCPSGLKVL
jgi:hypothetical protein